MDMAALLANPKPVDEDEAVTSICPLHGRRLNTVTRKCDHCTTFNKEHGGRRKAQPKREPYEDHGVERYTYVGKFDPEDFEKYLTRLNRDPVRLATAIADTRRPRRVDRVKYGVAIRARSPMLNADAGTIRNGLAKQEPEMRKHPKDKIYRVVTVKPQQLGTARNAGSWKEQTWTVWTLKYTKGLIIVTESGIESCLYPGWGAMMQGILNNGWEIVR